MPEKIWQCQCLEVSWIKFNLVEKAFNTALQVLHRPLRLPSPDRPCWRPDLLSSRRTKSQHRHPWSHQVIIWPWFIRGSKKKFVIQGPRPSARGSPRGPYVRPSLERPRWQGWLGHLSQGRRIHIRPGRNIRALIRFENLLFRTYQKPSTTQTDWPWSHGTNLYYLNM